jgi:hypothetical protein
MIYLMKIKMQTSVTAGILILCLLTGCQEKAGITSEAADADSSQSSNVSSLISSQETTLSEELTTSRSFTPTAAANELYKADGRTMTKEEYSLWLSSHSSSSQSDSSSVESSASDTVSDSSEANTEISQGSGNSVTNGTGQSANTESKNNIVNSTDNNSPSNTPSPVPISTPVPTAVPTPEPTPTPVPEPVIDGDTVISMVDSHGLIWDSSSANGGYFTESIWYQATNKSISDLISYEYNGMKSDLGYDSYYIIFDGDTFWCYYD